MTRASTCYMCDSPEMSREHAPPLCFFPAISDTGRELRRNLVTVPSCDIHNSKKSKDDEFFRSVVLMAAAPTSETGHHLFSGKMLRGAARMPHSHRLFFRDGGPIVEERGRVLQIDRPRFDTCVDHLAKALFYDTYKRKWSLPTTVVSPNFFSGIASDQVVSHKPTLDAVEVSRKALGSEPIRGENPDVFKYRLRYDAEEEIYAFAGIFYECFEVYSFSSKELAHSAV